jgi:hypothetical protein
LPSSSLCGREGYKVEVLWSAHSAKRQRLWQLEKSKKIYEQVAERFGLDDGTPYYVFVADYDRNWVE